MVGDPGGRSAERNLLDDATIDKNAEALRKQFKQLLGGVDFQMVNNADWLRKLNLLEFLRDVGKHFTVNEMIKRDSVRPRLETPDASISFTEFSYMLLQAYDYLQLHEKYECDLQVGGSDQWGNILSGVELIRRTTGDAAYAFSWPLLVDKTGKKFGKSEGNAVWLDATKTSPFKFYQFWFNADDEMVEELLLKMTLVPKEEIASVMAMHAKNPGGREAQKRLAREVTTLVHSAENSEKAENDAAALFKGGDISSVSAIPVDSGPHSSILGTIVITGLASSMREARQFVADGAISLNDEKIDNDRPLRESDFVDGKARLKRGKKHIVVIEPKKER